MKTELILFDEYEFFCEKCEMCPTTFDIGVSLYVDSGKSIVDELRDEKLFSDAAAKYIDICRKFGEKGKDESNILKAALTLRKNPRNFIDNIEYVRLAFNSRDVFKYIEENSFLHNKKIVIPENIGISDYEKIEELTKKYKAYKDIIYVTLDNNIDYVSLDEAYDTILKIKETADFITNLDLSPIEKIMYTYDIVRSRIYKDEDKDDRFTESRDLKAILNSDKIVCTGYANLFSALLNYMGIKCKSVGITSKKTGNGHERNLIYVKDAKYDIDGVYYFDTTWDSKKSDTDTNYINSYVYFAKTRKQIMQLENNNYRYDFEPDYSDNMVEHFSKELDEVDCISFAKGSLKSINYMARVVYGESLIKLENLISYSDSYKKYDKEEILEKIKNIQEKYDKPISAETFIEIFNNVRKLEYYQNPELYPYNKRKMYEALVTSQSKFEGNYSSGEEELLAQILGIKPKYNAKEMRQKNFVNYVAEEQIDKEIAEVKLTKVLSLYNKSRK